MTTNYTSSKTGLALDVWSLLAPLLYNALMQVTRSTLFAMVSVAALAISLSSLGAQQPPQPASQQQPPAPTQPAAPQNATPAQPATPQNATAGQPATPQNATPAQPAAGNMSPAGPGGGAPPPRPILPASASSVAAKPEAYYGQVVSIYAAVEQQLSPLAFSVDQDKTKSTGKEVLVLAPRLHEPVEPNTYLTVIGEVVRPDAAEIAKKAKAGTSGIPAEILAKHPDRPVILATAVINGAFTDLAKFLPPPMTPEEAAFDKTMKGVGAANGALRKGIDAANAELVKTNTAILLKSFIDAEGFWKTRGKADAVKFAQTAKNAVQAIDTAAGMGNWNEAKAQNTTLGQQCQSCHGAFRERGEDGSFFIKPGSSR